MSKHTQGPWYVVGDRIYRRPKHELYEYGGGVAGDKPIAIINKGWFADDEAGFPVEANARLIAAAPCLLEALKDWLESWKTGDGILESRDKAIEAIAKAEGE